MIEASLQEVPGHVILPRMDVDVCQEQPALLKLIGVNNAPVHFSYAFELIPGSRSLFQHHISCCHGQQCWHVIFLNSTKDFWLDRISLTAPPQLPFVYTQTKLTSLQYIQLNVSLTNKKRNNNRTSSDIYCTCSIQIQPAAV